MKPDDRIRALNAAALQLDWLTTQPWTRARAALEVLADTDTRATIAAGSTDNEGRRAVGGHSDPTCVAAVANLDVALDARRQARAIHTATADLAETARFIRTAIAGRVHLGPDTLAATATDIAWCLTVPHQIGAWTPTDDAQRDEVDHAIGHLHRQAELLAAKVAVILRSAVRPPEQAPKQKQLVTCRSCARFGITKDTDRYAHRCRRCGDFQAANHCQPTEAICRAWDRLGDRARITPGMILEAKAAATARTRRKRSA